MNTTKISKHLNQVRSTAEGIAVVTQAIQIRTDHGEETPILQTDIGYLTTALENLQAAFDDLKHEMEVPA